MAKLNNRFCNKTKHKLNNFLTGFLIDEMICGSTLEWEWVVFGIPDKLETLIVFWWLPSPHENTWVPPCGAPEWHCSWSRKPCPASGRNPGRDSGPAWCCTDPLRACLLQSPEVQCKTADATTYQSSLSSCLWIWPANKARNVSGNRSKALPYFRQIFDRFFSSK